VPQRNRNELGETTVNKTGQNDRQIKKDQPARQPALDPQHHAREQGASLTRFSSAIVSGSLVLPPLRAFCGLRSGTPRSA